MAVMEKIESSRNKNTFQRKFTLTGAKLAIGGPMGLMTKKTS